MLKKWNILGFVTTSSKLKRENAHMIKKELDVSYVQVCHITLTSMDIYHA
jgi:hypothetical protein